MKKITIQNREINYVSSQHGDFICLTDMVRGLEGDPRDYIRNWLRTGSTLEFLGVWEKVHNQNFNVVEFHHIKTEFIKNTFLMSTKKWIQRTDAIGLQAKAGRYGGTYAHSDIAIQFATWLSPEFYVYMIKEFQRLKEKEAEEAKETLEWNVKRILSKVNYEILTDSIKENLIPFKLEGKDQSGVVYASEADLLNVALFGLTAKQWKLANPDKKGNMRDFATAEQLLVLANLENINAEYIKDGFAQDERLIRLNDAAIHQMKVLSQSTALTKLLK
ncbi:KilA-N domain-containing protein [Aureispira anguillae]|uniref:KilA-N domain-containing protein n=1 Tax=Aureispira anguillae TaxID=2864201 RepID=A0A915YLU2_9BACT|nr:KilA-N domain-containing protein [Aureispira anguillae]BDS15605.1 KilA-N domain-containing protein [Aureispira anguillae]